MSLTAGAVPGQLRQRASGARSPAGCTSSGRSPAPGRPLFQAALANDTAGRAATAVDTRTAERGPLLIISGGADRTVPDSVSRAAFKLYGEVGRGHGVPASSPTGGTR